ncbi:hypothetical protein EV174_000451 [Coemansia sp. RSA 2320]|nr:hypothetical protein EV174_000451 [Coemansia sp. RSA 2320]
MCQQSSVRQSGAGLVRALEIAALTLQLLVNLSNNSTTFCARFVECKGLDIVSKSIAFISQRLEVPGSAAEHGTAEFSPRRKALANDVSDLRYDILLITSALLTNVVDSDPSSTLYFSHVLQSPQCKLVVQCFPECVCSGRLPLSVLLTRSFLACHSAGGAADAAVAAGYLSVLLGVLVREKTDGRKSILQLLPGQSTALLIAHIESFIQVSDEVNRRFAGLLGGLAHLPQSNSQVAASRHLNPRMLQIHGADEGCNANALAIPRASASCSVAPSKISASLRTVIESLSGLQ